MAAAKRSLIDWLKQLDFTLLLLTSMLLFAGCLFIYGVGQEAGGEFVRYWVKQLMWLGLGMGAFVAVVCVDYRLWGRWSWLLYTGGVALLVLVLVVGREVHGARSWLVVPGGTLQPAEVMKPATVLLLAWVGSRPALELKHVGHVGILGVVAACPVLLVALQPDWGTCLTFIPVFLAIVFAGGLRWRWLVLAVLMAVVSAPLVYEFGLAPHQQQRIRTFLHPSEDVSDSGWNAHQSLLAVGSGGVWGKGYMRGTQHVLGFLPRTVAPTDFIFSVVAEESGFVGAGAMVCAFVGVILCCLRTAAVAADRFGAYLATGVAALFFIHAFVNVGMTVGVAPIIGIPLPFVSYGGSFMLCCMIALGLVQNVHMRRQLADE